jgi:RNA polymerase sigma factor (sigma-70 family)
MALGSVEADGAERDPRTPEVLELLLENHARFLGFLERRVGSRDDAEDILQEAFVRSLDRAPSLRDSESATTWFYRVLRNAITDHFRRQDSRLRIDLHDPSYLELVQVIGDHERGVIPLIFLDLATPRAADPCEAPIGNLVNALRVHATED